MPMEAIVMITIPST